MNLYSSKYKKKMNSPFSISRIIKGKGVPERTKQDDLFKMHTALNYKCYTRIKKRIPDHVHAGVSWIWHIHIALSIDDIWFLVSAGDTTTMPLGSLGWLTLFLRTWHKEQA
ncbi:hypothetical protein ACJX0J_018088, partial [Zea mays]